MSTKNNTSNENAKNIIVNETAQSALSNLERVDLEIIVKGLENTKQKVDYTIAYTLNVIRKTYADDIANEGFNSFSEYAENKFGYSKQRTSTLVNVADKFLTTNKVDEVITSDKVNAKGELMPVVNPELIIDGLKDTYNCRYSISAMGELMALNSERKNDKGKFEKANLSEIQLFIDENAIDSSTSCSKIRELVKKHNTPVVETTAESTGDGAESTGDGADGADGAVITDLDRLNSILNIVKDIENTDMKDAFSKICNVWKNQF